MARALSTRTTALTRSKSDAIWNGVSTSKYSITVRAMEEEKKKKKEIRFRNYAPMDSRLADSVEAREASIEAVAGSCVVAESAGEARKEDWDLKRDLQEEMEELAHRTRIAVQQIRQAQAESQR